MFFVKGSLGENDVFLLALMETFMMASHSQKLGLIRSHVLANYMGVVPSTFHPGTRKTMKNEGF